MKRVYPEVDLDIMRAFEFIMDIAQRLSGTHRYQYLAPYVAGYGSGVPSRPGEAYGACLALRVVMDQDQETVRLRAEKVWTP